MKIRFEILREQHHDPEFVEKILEAEQEIQHGKGLKVTSKKFDELCK